MKVRAVLYRIVAPDHLCPRGIKAWNPLKHRSYEVNDHHLESGEANREFKEEHAVNENPRVFVGGEPVGGYDALREHPGLGPDPKEGETCQPVLAIFAVTLAMAMAVWMMVKVVG